jgi:hypothetical protein
VEKTLKILYQRGETTDAREYKNKRKRREKRRKLTLALFVGLSPHNNFFFLLIFSLISLFLKKKRTDTLRAVSARATGVGVVATTALERQDVPHPTTFGTRTATTRRALPG